MPLVKIEIIRGQTPEYRKTLLASIHEALVESFGIADWDRFQRLYEMDMENFETSVEKTEKFTLIELTIFPGRTKEQKNAAIKAISQKLNERLGIPATDIFIIMNEPPLENWGLGGNQKG